MQRGSATLLFALKPRWRTAKSHLTRAKSTFAQTDSVGIPIQPTWSVNELLSSYPQPTISPTTLKRLHELSALIPPAEGTLKHAQLTREMEALVKLVEAVKLVDTSAVQETDAGVPDGRVWAEGFGIELDKTASSPQDSDGASGRKLLWHSNRVKDGLYVVDSDKSK